MTKEVTIHFMPNNDVDGAGYLPYEDVPREGVLEEAEIFGEVCIKCGGETVERLLGDELITYCPDCGI